MSTPRLVEDFYSRIWNDGDLAAIPELLSPDFAFRGSLGSQLRGHKAFREYVNSIRDALAEYHCELLACVAESDRAFAQMHFSGQHVKKFRGYDPTGKAVHWSGAALFQFGDGKITSLWVLGDLNGLDAVLRANESTT